MNQHRKYARSSSFQMALLFTILCGVAIAVLGYFGYYFARGYFIHGTEAIIESEIRYVSTLQNPLSPPPHPERLYLQLPRDGSTPAELKNISLLSEGIILLKTPETNKTYAARILTLEDGEKILIGVDISKTINDYRVMFWLSLLSILFMTIVIGVSYLISIFVVNGTNQIANTAREIMETGDLSRRIEIKSRWDDLSNMAETLNLLLLRINQLMQGVRQVSDNIAHDLRTPLTRLKNRLEDLKYKDPKNSNYEELVREIDHLLSTFNALLRISRIENEQQKSQFQEVDLAQIIMDVASFYEPLAEEKNIALICDIQTATRYGDRDLLFQSFINLLDNALKFTAIGGQIHMRVATHHGQAVIEIEDSGPGIPLKDLDRVFERFYRSEESRNTPGTGLGLSLVAAAIKLHNGTISLKNTGKGLRIITVL